MQIYDISIQISEGTPVWEGEDGVTISNLNKINATSDFNVSRIELGVHSGTHVDAPYHVLENGYSVDQIPLDALVGSSQVVEIPDSVSVIDNNCLKNLDFIDGIERILFKTSNSQYWKEDRYKFKKEYVALNSQGAKYLADMDLRLVGIDYFSVSTYNDLIQPHKILLHRGVVILENADLRKVLPGIYELICLPLNILGVEGAPARAVLISR